MSAIAQVADPATPAQFLAAVRSRACRYAALCGADAGSPGQRVERAAAAFRQRAPTRAVDQWPALFWSGLVAASGDGGPPPTAATPLTDALYRLPLPERQAFLLRAWLDFSPAEAARLLDIGPEQFQRDLHRALRQLRSLVAADSDGYGWVRTVRAELDRPIQPAPPAAARPPPRPPLPRRRWVGAGLIGIGCVLALAALLRPSAEPPAAEGSLSAAAPSLPAADPIEHLLSLPADDFELLLQSDTDLRLFEELDLHRWLEQPPESTDAG